LAHNFPPRLFAFRPSIAPCQQGKKLWSTHDLDAESCHFPFQSRVIFPIVISGYDEVRLAGNSASQNEVTRIKASFIQASINGEVIF